MFPEIKKMKKKNNMRAYSPKQIKENLKRDRNLLRECRKDYAAELDWAYSTLCDGYYNDKPFSFELKVDNIRAYHEPYIETLKNRVAYWQRRLANKQFKH